MASKRVVGPSGSSGVNENNYQTGESGGGRLNAGEDDLHGFYDNNSLPGLDSPYPQPRETPRQESRRLRRLAIIGILTAAVVAALGASAGLLSKGAAQEGRLEPAQQVAPALPAEGQPAEDVGQAPTPPAVEPPPQQAADTAESGEQTIPTEPAAGPPVEAGGAGDVAEEGAKEEAGGQPPAAEESEGKDEDKSGEKEAEKETAKEAEVEQETSPASVQTAEPPPVEQQAEGTAESGEEGEDPAKPQQPAVEESEGKEAAGDTKPEAGQPEGEAEREEPLVKDEETSGKKEDVKEEGAPDKGAAEEQVPVTPPAEEKSPADKPPAKDLIDTLKAGKFDDVYKVNKDDLASIAQHIEGPLSEVVEVDGQFVLREHLKDFEAGQMLDISTLHVYSQRVAERNLVLSPLQFSAALGEYLQSKKEPSVPQDIIDRAQKANKVLFVLATPLYIFEEKKYTPYPRHFLLSVIDRERKVVSIVDSLPQAQEYYQPMVAFLKNIAAQLDGDYKAPYDSAPHTPEPGFPTQAEFRPNFQKISQELWNACGPFALENLICVAENRQPNYQLEDVISLRNRILLELFEGLWVRPLRNGDMRDAED